MMPIPIPVINIPNINSIIISFTKDPLKGQSFSIIHIMPESSKLVYIVFAPKAFPMIKKPTINKIKFIIIIKAPTGSLGK